MKNEDFDFSISRSFFPDPLWHRAEPRRSSRPDRTVEELARLRRLLDEWVAEALLQKNRADALEARLAAMARPTIRKPVAYSGILELRST